jgi:hypothetical protein
VNIDRIRRENEAYRKANPWGIVNLESSNTMFSRFPTREAAEAYAARYRGGVHSVSEVSKTVYIAEIPCL